MDRLLDYKQIEELDYFTSELGIKNDIENLYIPNPGKCLDRHNHNSKCVISFLAKHPIFDMIGGHPMIISLFTPLLVDRTLKEFFNFMSESPLFDILTGEMKDDPLIISLEYAVNLISLKNP
jgi:hypothetical protein